MKNCWYMTKCVEDLQALKWMPLPMHANFSSCLFVLSFSFPLHFISFAHNLWMLILLLSELRMRFFLWMNRMKLCIFLLSKHSSYLISNKRIFFFDLLMSLFFISWKKLKIHWNLKKTINNGICWMLSCKMCSEVFHSIELL